MSDKSQHSSLAVPAVAVCLLYQQKILLGKRPLADGGYCWQLPGGKVMAGESLLQAAERELREETGIVAAQLKAVILCEDNTASQSYLSVIFQAQLNAAVEIRPQLAEPCQDWRWFDEHALPAELFKPLKALLTRGFNPFDLHSALLMTTLDD